MNLFRFFNYPLFLLLLWAVLIHPVPSFAEESLYKLDLEQLMDIQVTSAGRKAQNLVDVPAAVYVIDQDDIRNSGATSIPELLRMVPGLQVARIGSSRWAVSSRGFNNSYANKLLVQIDGRSIYSPSYSGVYWDAQNVMLDDIDRIEVIRGPGATLWGANAVNGIINIITKESSQTQGGKVNLASGNHEKLIAEARYGGKLEQFSYGRFYLHRHDRDAFDSMGGEAGADDEWDVSAAGFRLDGDVGIDSSWTVQGDLYRNDGERTTDLFVDSAPYYAKVSDDYAVSGHNLLARWERKASESKATSLQVYYDYTKRDEVYLEQVNHTLDVDFQNRFQLGRRQDFVWGLGYRYNKDFFGNTFQLAMLPDKDEQHLFSGFVQDEVTLVDDQVWLTAGVKLEHNDYTDFEYQPTLRLLWKPAENHRLWSSVSRAVRTPSRLERGSYMTQFAGELALPPTFVPQLVTFRYYGNEDYDSERLIAYEAGYRYAASETFSVELALYYNDYSNLRVYVAGADMTETLIDNGAEGSTYGVEVMTRWLPFEWLETELSYTFIEMALKAYDSAAVSTVADEDDATPKHQMFSRFLFKLRDDLNLNLAVRYVDELDVEAIFAASGAEVDSYVEMDANIRWAATDNLDIMLVGQNLFDPHRLEMIPFSYSTPVEVGRSLYAKLSWTF